MLAVLGSLLLACEGDPYGNRPSAPAKAADGKAVSAPPADGKAVDADGGKKAVPITHADGQPLAKVLEPTPLPWVKMLGQSPQDAESHLGPPKPDSKGGTREACVRYLPERTWFHCKQAWQRYSDKTGTFGEVHVVYEDGKVTALAFDGIPGEGPFDPKLALRKVGLELPGEAKPENPAADVTLWSWWNSTARLLVHDRQYRVRVSTVGGAWDKAKVEIILNDVLRDDEKSRVFDPGAAAADGGEGAAGG